jgi:hypothetical protein
MKITFNIYSVIGIIYITIMTTLASSSVGTVNESCGEPYSWMLPFTMFMILVLPFVLGGLAERDKHEKPD